MIEETNSMTQEERAARIEELKERIEYTKRSRASKSMDVGMADKVRMEQGLSRSEAFDQGIDDSLTESTLRRYTYEINKMQSELDDLLKEAEAEERKKE